MQPMTKELQTKPFTLGEVRWLMFVSAVVGFLIGLVW